MDEELQHVSIKLCREQWRVRVHEALPLVQVQAKMRRREGGTEHLH